MRSCLPALLAFSALGLAGCATTAPDGSPRERNPDPLEPINRGVFRFNDAIDRYALRPVAVAYRENTPKLVQTGVGNFFENLSYPTTILHQFLQGKFKQGAPGHRALPAQHDARLGRRDRRRLGRHVACPSTTRTPARRSAGGACRPGRT